MGRFFIDRENIHDGKAIISGAEARHISGVMRLGTGDCLVLFDGNGFEYSGIIESVSSGNKEIKVIINETREMPGENIPALTLAQAIPKKNRMEQVLEKSTELGVSSIIPMVTERTIVRPVGRSGDKVVERWRKIAVETSKQCGRSVVPEIRQVTSFTDVLRSAGNFSLRLMACLSRESRPMGQILHRPLPQSIIVMIGPEGDFTPREIDKAKSDNFVMTSLGNRVLKSDTAGLFMLSVLIYEGGCYPAVSPGKGV